MAGQAHGQPGDVAAAAVDDGEVFGKGQRGQPGLAPGGRQASQAARHLVSQAEGAGLALMHLAIGRHGRGQPQRLGPPAIPGPRVGVLGSRVAEQRVQRRRGVEAALMAQRLRPEGSQHRQLFALVA